MRSFRHLTPRYIVNRIRTIIYERRYPAHPWLTPEANRILEGWLKESDRMLEFGSGRSTLWFARRVGHLVSVEHDAEWHARVSKNLEEARFDNVRYIHAKSTNGQPDCREYLKILDDIEDASLDIVLVDGVCRDKCAVGSVPKLRAGGLMVVDNANWYLPCRSHSPNSRTPSQGAATEEWKRFLRMVADWRTIWTSSGVTDTAFFIRPCGQDRQGQSCPETSGDDTT